MPPPPVLLCASAQVFVGFRFLLPEQQQRVVQLYRQTVVTKAKESRDYVVEGVPFFRGAGVGGAVGPGLAGAWGGGPPAHVRARASLRMCCGGCGSVGGAPPAARACGPCGHAERRWIGARWSLSGRRRSAAARTRRSPPTTGDTAHRPWGRWQGVLCDESDGHEGV